MALQEMIMSDTKLPNTYRLGLFGEKYRAGIVEGEREMLLLILEGRGFNITEEIRRRVESIRTAEELQAHARRDERPRHRSGLRRSLTTPAAKARSHPEAGLFAAPRRFSR